MCYKYFKTRIIDAYKSDKTDLASLNWYRNAHYHDQNKFKQEFAEIATNQLKDFKTCNKYRLEIVLYYKNPNCDGANVVSLIEKVVLDALQTNNIVTNDNINYHLGTTWSVGGKDIVNPRCEIKLLEM